jgi:hypothetical protein
MPKTPIDIAFEYDDTFDPLMVDDLDIDQEAMDEDNPLDTVDFPTMRNMPKETSREAVYTPERQGGIRGAVLALLDHNPARRPVLLAILDMCRDGLTSSAVAAAIDELQKDNRSVYAPMTFCRMLERAGALELEMPEVTQSYEDIDRGVEHLTISERVDPVWRTTKDAAYLHAEFMDGTRFRDLVLNRDGVYREVYKTVMEAALECPRSKAEIEEIVDTFEIVKNPRRFGGHFIDILERTDALQWKDHAWQLTDLGRTMLVSMNGIDRR